MHCRHIKPYREMWLNHVEIALQPGSSGLHCFAALLGSLIMSSATCSETLVCSGFCNGCLYGHEQIDFLKLSLTHLIKRNKLSTREISFGQVPKTIDRRV